MNLLRIKWRLHVPFSGGGEGGSRVRKNLNGKSLSFLPDFFGLFLIFLVELWRGFDLPYPLLRLFREQIYRLARNAALLWMSPAGYTVGARAAEEKKHEI